MEAEWDQVSILFAAAMQILAEDTKCERNKGFRYLGAVQETRETGSLVH